MRYTTLLLDLDHTLFDSDTCELAAFEKTLGAVGVDEPLRHHQTYVEINRSMWSSVEQGEITPADVRVTRFERLITEIGLDANPESMADTFVLELVANGDLYTGAREVLEELARQATLAMVTNGLSEVQRARIERLDIEQYFDAIVISAEIGASKPGSEIFDATFRALGSPTKDTALMIGDSLASDIRGGANYGIATCWYNPQGKIADPDAGVNHEITRLDQLPAIATYGSSA
jgi:YjjG family noncanonical pyrimidine nucleotidase